MCLPATGQMCSNMPSYDMIMNGMIMACWIMLDQEHVGSWHVGDDDRELVELNSFAATRVQLHQPA